MVRLRSSGFGCCVFVVYFGCLMFADDILLTHSVLSRLWDICWWHVIYAVEIVIQIVINLCCAYWSSLWCPVCEPMSWLVIIFATLHQLKYLGVVLDTTKYFRCLTDYIIVF